MKGYLDELLGEIQSDLSNKGQYPKTVYDPKTKNISVTHDFDSGHIPGIKMKADCKTWLDKFYRLDFDNATFQNIAHLFSRVSKRNIRLLKQYSIGNPCQFTSDVLEVFYAMLYENREYKPRKIPRGSLYGFDPAEKAEISVLTANLYVYLKRMSRISDRNWSQDLKKIYRKSGAENYDDLHDIVRKIMSKYTGLKLSERFFQTFVSEAPVKLSLVKKSPNQTPSNNPFLKAIFQKILS
jgi:hypothetical protein